MVYKPHEYYSSIVIGTINHSYWSYVHQLSYRLGAPLCTPIQFPNALSSGPGGAHAVPPRELQRIFDACDLESCGSLTGEDSDGDWVRKMNWA
jgi:hypothetical protein